MLASREFAFQEIVTSVISSRIEVRPCPDQYVGLVRNLTHSDDFRQRLTVNRRRTGGAAIILVTESPHVREYLGDPGPARGKTGQNIRSHLRSVLSTYKLNSYDLILINAIQYQCSLGLPTRIFRDQVFRQVWSSFGRADFVNRLTKIYRYGDLLVNACTKGNTKDKAPELRRLVEDAIRSVRLTGSDEKVYHPSSWHFAQRRAGRWE